MKDIESSLQFDGLSISVSRGVDGVIVIEMDGPSDEANDGKDCVPSGPYEGSPDFRVYMNDTMIYAHGQSGHDLGNEPLDPSVTEAMDRLDEAIVEEDRLEQQRRDEKNELYPGKEDSAN